MDKRLNDCKKEKTILEDLLKIQQTAIETAEREIYENITQCLCLARLQILEVNIEDKDKLTSVLGETSLLLGKVIKDLRSLAKNIRN